MKTFHWISTLVLLAAMQSAAAGREYHVSVDGDDTSDGAAATPLRTISAAAALAQPGDVVTVREGVYREWVDPPRGGASDEQRIVYQAAPGEQVEVKGSEVITGWKPLKDGVWKVTLPNTFFGEYNPYDDPIHGDWFNGKGREHHTGAVYLNGEWLTEAAKLQDLMLPPGKTPDWLQQAGDDVLLNVAWLQPEGGARVPAAEPSAKKGTRNAECSEGGECVGWIAHGNWLKYEGIDFGERTERLEIRAASATRGGTIEVRLDGPEGTLLGACEVPNTGGWQSWRSFNVNFSPVSGVNTVCLVFKSNQRHPVNTQLWFAKVDDKETAIWAQFGDANPNEELVEINVRRAVFYPRAPGRNYITVRGFTLRHAATQWAPPTAVQIGLIGTHWSKGWVIENNTVSHSRCTGITLGKYGDEFDNTSADTAEGYVKTIERALENGWSRENIGGHVVRNNTISHCEQAGLVGSLGAVFSTITGNVIHDIHVQRLFTGAEMAGIKIHAAIDTEISGNRIYRTIRGIWLDWMNQGSRVTGNLLYENIGEDLFVEVNHGPFLVDNNFFLSHVAVLNMSQGGAYAHNLFAGRILPRPEMNRETPYHPAHTTEVAGLSRIPGGDDRFYNNLFVGGNGLSEYDGVSLPVHMAGNVFLAGAAPSKHEDNPLVMKDFDPGLQLVEDAGAVHLRVRLDASWAAEAGAVPVTTELLGRAKIPDLPYVNPDGSPLRIDTGYFGKTRDGEAPFPGPFASPEDGEQQLAVWP